MKKEKFKHKFNDLADLKALIKEVPKEECQVYATKNLTQDAENKNITENK
jgi:hypothetical protein